MQYTIEDLGHFYLQSIGLETYDHYSKKHIENLGWQVLESYGSIDKAIDYFINKDTFYHFPILPHFKNEFHF